MLFSYLNNFIYVINKHTNRVRDKIIRTHDICNFWYEFSDTNYKCDNEAPQTGVFKND